MTPYVLGILCGIILGVLVFLLVRVKNPDRRKYDERQMIGRGKAYQAGFFTLLIADAVCNIWDYVGTLPYDAAYWHFGAILLGIGVFAVTAIHFDAYVGMNDTPKRFIRMGALLTIAMVLSAISNFSRLNSERSLMVFLNLGVAVLWVVIIAALVIHNRNMAAEDEE